VNNYFSNGESRKISTTTIINYLPSFGINVYSNEKSDFDVVDIIIFNRELTSSEISLIVGNLSIFYGIPISSSSQIITQ